MNFLLTSRLSSGFQKPLAVTAMKEINNAVDELFNYGQLHMREASRNYARNADQDMANCSDELAGILKLGANFYKQFAILELDINRMKNSLSQLVKLNPQSETERLSNSVRCSVPSNAEETLRSNNREDSTVNGTAYLSPRSTEDSLTYDKDSVMTCDSGVFCTDSTPNSQCVEVIGSDQSPISSNTDTSAKNNGNTSDINLDLNCTLDVLPAEMSDMASTNADLAATSIPRVVQRRTRRTTPMDRMKSKSLSLRPRKIETPRLCVSLHKVDVVEKSSAILIRAKSFPKPKNVQFHSTFGCKTIFVPTIGECAYHPKYVVWLPDHMSKPKQLINSNTWKASGVFLLPSSVSTYDYVYACRKGDCKFYFQYRSTRDYHELQPKQNCKF